MKKKAMKFVSMLVLLCIIMSTVVVTASAASISDNALSSLISVAKNAVGKTREELGLPNGPWCGRFVGYCINKSNVGKSIGQITTPQCAYAIDLADWVCSTKSAGTFYVFSSGHDIRVKKLYPGLKEKGRVESASNKKFTPKEGDLVQFCWSGWSSPYSFDHVGIVTKVSANTITYIDGNSSSGKGKVASHTMSKTSENIIGYVRLNANGNLSDDTAPSEDQSGTNFDIGTYTVNHYLGVNVRAGASTSYSSVGVATNGIGFTVTNISGDWGYTASIKTHAGVKSGWVNLTYCKKANTQITFSSVSAPNGGTVSCGKGYHLTGTIYSTGSNIASITAKVTDQFSRNIFSKSVNVNSRAYTLNESVLDYAMTFGDLDVGSYKLCYEVKAKDGTTEKKTLNFSVKEDKSTHTLASISGSNAPGNLKIGQSFSIQGSIKSGSKLTSVCVGVYAADGTMKIGKTVKPNVNNYNLSNIDYDITFGKLPASAYTYRVTAVNAAGSVTLVDKKFAVIMDGWFTLSPKSAPNSSLDVQGAKTGNGVNVQIYKKNKSAAQQWKLTHVGNGYYTITSKCSNKALDVKGGVSKSGTNVQQYAHNGTASQKWFLEDAGNGYYYLCPQLNSNLALDVCNGDIANGTNVWVYSRNRTNAQKWKIQRV